MEHLITPAGYKPVLDLRETQVAIKEIKDFFQRELAKQLNLTRVSAPLFVLPESGLNDNLNGVERPVSFRYQRSARECRDCTLSRQMEKIRIKKIRLCTR